MKPMEYTMKMIYDMATGTYTITLDGETLLECVSMDQAIHMTFGEAIKLSNEF